MTVKNTNSGNEAQNSRHSKRVAPKDNSLNAEFTPGPWRLRGYSRSVMDDYGNSRWSGNIGPDQPVTKSDKKDVGCILSTSAFGIFGRSPKEAEANARLIAAAPALYDALVTLLDTETNLNGVSAVVLLDAVDKARTAIALANGQAASELKG